MVEPISIAWPLPAARKAQILAELETAVRAAMASVRNPVHDDKHVQRVRRQARRAAREMGVDPDLADLAALLHDLGRAVEHEHPGVNHADLSRAMSVELLARYEADLPAPLQAEVLHAIEKHSRVGCDTPLLATLKEADALDTLGAIGIARAVMTWAGGPDYDPERLRQAPVEWNPPRIHTMTDQLRFQMGLLREIQTEGGRRIARQRLSLMQAFWDQLWDEIEGKE